MTTLYAAPLTHPGSRAANEAAVGVGDGLSVLADGLGGHRPGVVASRSVVETIFSNPLVAAEELSFDSIESIGSRVARADAALLVVQTADQCVPRSLLNSRVISKREIRGDEARNRLLGTIGQLRTEHGGTAIVPGDALLRCSNCLWKEMAVDCSAAATPAEWLARIGLRLLERAADDHDNACTVAVWLGAA